VVAITGDRLLDTHKVGSIWKFHFHFEHIVIIRHYYHKMDQKRLKATENYVYCVMDDLIGKGATCEVYRGIHKVLLFCFPPIYSTF